MVIYGARGEKAREHALASRLLELAAAETWGLSPLPPVERASGGKPHFADRDGWEFNLSHSGGTVLCALDSSPVGVDIQTLREPGEALLQRALSPEERAWLEASPRRAEAFTALWTLKESLVKRGGEGLSLGRLARLPIPLPEGEGPRQLGGLWFRLYRGEGWLGAVCGSVPPPASICWRELPPLE